tara:strand:- start:6359 stop:6637 length:279 start_codon:yes stop_codon:yes gene_type:complete
MDDILKKTMYKEVQDLLDQISSVVEKYNYSEELIYTAAFGMLEEEGEMNRWTLAYGWNCRDMDEFGEFMALQIQAYTAEQESDEGFMEFSLN